MKLLKIGSIASFLMALPYVALAQGLVQPPPFAGTARSPLETALYNIVNFALILAGIIAAIYLVFGGVRYITSGGDEDAAGEAKQTILYAVIGLIVIGLSAAIVQFVFRALAAA
jgi:hypothetical protein